MKQTIKNRGNEMKKGIAKKLTNLEMNNETFVLRSEVMALIYEAKKMVELPRLTVRITEDNENILGLARMGNSVKFHQGKFL